MKETKVHLWDTRLGMELGVMPVRGYLLRFAPHTKRLAYAANSAIHLIDAATRQPVWASVSLDSIPVALSWSTDEKQLHIITRDGKYRRINAATGVAEPPAAFTLKIDPEMMDLLDAGFQPVISPDGRYFAQGHFEDDTLKLWDLQTGKTVFSAKDHDHFMGQVSFSPDSGLLASPGGEGTIVVREIPSGKVVHRLRGHRGWVWSVAFSADGKYLASGAKDTTVRLWDVGSGETIQTFRGHLSEVYGVAFGGSALFSYGPEGTVRVWDAADPIIYSPHVWDHLKKQGFPPFVHSTENDSLVLLHHSALRQDLVFSPDGRRLATSAYGDDDLPCQVVIRDLITRRETCRIATPAAEQRAIAFSSDGRLLGVLLHLQKGKDSAMELRVYDSTTGDLAWRAEGPKSERAFLIVDPAAGGFEVQYILARSAGVMIVRHDAAKGLELQKLKLAGAVYRIVHGGDGKRLFGVRFGVKKDLQICEFNSAKGSVVKAWNIGYQNLIEFDAMGGLIATAHAGTGPADIVLWDAATGAQLRKLTGSVGMVVSVAFSPDGRRLVSCGSDFAVRIWDTNSGRELLTLSNHGDVVSKVCWSPDGARIASACQDGAVRVWEADSSGPLPNVDSWELISPTDLASQDKKQFLKDSNGDWKIDDGVLNGTLQLHPKLNFPVAGTGLRNIDLPRTVDIRCQVETSQPMLISFSLSNPATNLIYSPFIAATSQPFGEPGAGLLVTNDPSFKNYTIQGIVHTFPFEANRPYNFRVLRQEDRLRFFIDGQELLSERIPNIELPQLGIGGSWSKVGDEIRFSRIEVRAPAAAVQKRKLCAKLEQIFNEELIPEIVSERLAQDSTLTPADRQLLSAVLIEYPLNLDALRKSARAISTKEGATPEELRRARRQAQAALKIEGGNAAKPTAESAGDLGLLALLEYRLGNAAASADILKTLLPKIREVQGFNNLGELCARRPCRTCPWPRRRRQARSPADARPGSTPGEVGCLWAVGNPGQAACRNADSARSVARGIEGSLFANRERRLDTPKAGPVYRRPLTRLPGRRTARRSTRPL